MNVDKIPTTKWYGWGDSSKKYNLDNKPGFWRFLKQCFNVPKEKIVKIPHISEITVPKSRLTRDHLIFLCRLLGTENVCSATETRIRHSIGKSYFDLIRIRRKQITNFADTVVFPTLECQIFELLKWAGGNNIAIIPFGGGTSVVGGVEAIKNENQKVIVVISLGRLNKIIRIEPQNQMIEAEAGILGPKLEAFLKKNKMSLRHSPESFEYSTLGGWIASGSSGQFSTKYGSIEEMIESLTVVTPKGIFNTMPCPRQATGPNWKHIIAGSEGTLGIVTRARMKIKPLPEKKYLRAYLLRNFETAVRITMFIMNSEIKPSLLRIQDEGETDLAFALAGLPEKGIKGGIVSGFKKYLDLRGYKPLERCLMMIGFEGTKKEIDSQTKKFKQIISFYPHLSLGPWPVKLWHKHKYNNPYLRDELMDYGFMIDTLETSTEWKNILKVYHNVIDEIEQALWSTKTKGFVMGHLSHCYPQGSSLYFIIIAQPEIGKEIEIWKQIKKAASDEIVAQNCPISHHHGVGCDHLEWYKKQTDAPFQTLLTAMKKDIDPEGILNPGKLA